MTSPALTDAVAPLVVGVTGHRDLRPQDWEKTKKAVHSVLDELQKTYSPTPVVVLSALAEGADCLVAKVAKDLGIRLIAPLPLPDHLYEKDFTSLEAIDLF